MRFAIKHGGLLAFFYAVGAALGNPIDPYSLPFISEYMMTDSINWTIELDLNEAMTMRAPCTTNVLKLRIASHQTIFPIKAVFDTAGIALLRRNSITDGSGGQYVTIRVTDTIQILDSMWNDSNNRWRAWIFYVRPVKTGNSLVNMGKNNGSFETTRPSIGSRGNYVTDYTLYLLDLSGKQRICDQQGY